MDNQINQTSESGFNPRSGFARFSKEEWENMDSEIKNFLIENTGEILVDGKAVQ